MSVVGSSPSTASSEESEDDEKQHGTDGGGDNGTDYAGANMDVQPGQEPSADEGTDNANDEVSDEAKTGSPHHLAGEPSRNDTDHQNQQQTLIRKVHEPPPGRTLRNFQNGDDSRVRVKVCT
jgi:hypothetical protein